MKNKILIAITCIASIIAILAGASLDSEGYLAHLICAVCLVWLALFVTANRR